MQILIEMGVNIDSQLQDNEGRSALMFACIKGRKDSVELLINNGADRNLQNKFGQTALMIACKEGHTVCVQALINNGADTNLQDEEGNSALMIHRRRKRGARGRLAPPSFKLGGGGITPQLYPLFT